MRYPFIHQERQTYPVQLFCAVLQVSPSGYDRLVPRGGGRAQPDPALILQIQRLQRASRGTYGSRRMCQALPQAGYSLGRYRTRTLMRQAPLNPRRAWRRPQTTDSRHALPIAPNVLNRQFAVAAPKRVWGREITALWTQEGGGLSRWWSISFPAKSWAGRVRRRWRRASSREPCKWP